MAERFIYNESILNAVVGGHSSLDIPRLHIHSLEAASAFISGYGFEITNTQHVEKLWDYHRRALVFMQDKLKISLSELPPELAERRELGDIRKLLVYASNVSFEQKIYQKWACAILRCMHVFVHAESDLFSVFTEQIQAQIIHPIEAAVKYDGVRHKPYLQSITEGQQEQIDLVEFEAKPFKTSSSTAVKLLAKKDALAMKIFDKLGVRFITESLFDTFQVVRFLVRENIISFPHIMSDQSSNNLYPVDEFLKVCADLAQRLDTLDSNSIQKAFDEHLKTLYGSEKFFRKENIFSGNDYRFIKFICRKLIRIPNVQGGGELSFFFPFEVQILDQHSHESHATGDSSHLAYKERQREAARRRLFPEGL